MSRKLSQDEVIARIIELHGDNINTSKVFYINSSIKFEIGCVHCGRWWKTYLGNIVNKKTGCLRCSHLSNDNDFVIKANKIHNHAYAYKTKYVDTLTHIKIRCLRCLTEFEQKPCVHLQGKGCPTCNKSGPKPFNVKTLIDKASAIHGTELDFSKIAVDTIGTRSRPSITCNRCLNTFQKSWTNLIHHRHSCPWCASRTSAKERAWLNEINVPDDPKHRQVRIPSTRFKVDALVEHIVYEFNGTYYHGDPRIYSHDYINKRNKKTMGFLFNRTLEKHKRLENLGYTVRFVWELDYDAGLRFSTKHPSYKSE